MTHSENVTDRRAPGGRRIRMASERWTAEAASNSDSWHGEHNLASAACEEFMQPTAWLHIGQEIRWFQR
jgi:hypothetical protein